MSRKTLTPQIIMHDSQLLAVHKPAGMPTITGRGTPVISCRRWLADEMFGGEYRAVLPIHRIDADTSGLLLFARTPEAQRALSIQFQNRQVRKEYHAIVLGGPVADEGVVEISIGSDRRRLNLSKLDPQHGKSACTEYRVLERFRGYAFVACHPKTGRRHQIRLHMKALGCPLAVDPLYNPPEKPRAKPWETGGRARPGDDDDQDRSKEDGNEDRFGEFQNEEAMIKEEDNGIGLYVSDFKRGFKRGKHKSPVIARLTLHSYQLQFVHPGTQAEMTLIAEPPKDFRAALNQLRKWAGTGT